MRKLRQVLGKQQSEAALAKYTSREAVTTDACESGIPRDCVQGQSIWMIPHGMCLGEASEGAQKLTLGTREWRVEKRKGLGLIPKRRQQ